MREIEFPLGMWREMERQGFSKQHGFIEQLPGSFGELGHNHALTIFLLQLLSNEHGADKGGDTEAAGLEEDQPQRVILLPPLVEVLHNFLL